MPHMLKDIAVFFDASDFGLRVLETAARLAGAQSARLVGITTNYAPDAHPQDAFVRGNAISDVILRHEASVAGSLFKAGQALAHVAAADDLLFEFRVIPYGESNAEVALHSLHCDLLVVGHPSAPGAPLFWSATKVLRQTGVPLLIVPAHWQVGTVGRRVLATWNASRQARRALADALPLLSAAEAVKLLIVDPERKAGAYGDDPGADIAAYLARHGVSVELQRLLSQGQSVADAIVMQARKDAADLIVFGAYSRSELSEAVLGGVTRTLLTEVPLPLFVSH